MTQLIDLGKLRFYFAGEYSPSTTYEVNDVVKYGGNVYVYTSVVAAAGVLPTNTSNWALMLKGINFEGVYSPATAYQVGDGVAHGGRVYIAIANSTGQVPPNPTYWSQFVDGIQYEGVYNPVTSYQIGDVVTYGGKAYIAKIDTSGNLPTNATYWDKFVDGISPEGVYNAATTYQPGDIVAYGANLYIAKATSLNNVPTNTSFWDPFVSGIDVRGDWVTSTQYYVNDVVYRGGSTYIALVSHVSGFWDADLFDLKWEKFSGGLRFRGDFAASTAYLADDLVFDGISTYIANQDFTSGASIAADSDKWDLFAAGADYLPGQTGNQGKFLSTDGTDPLWTNTTNKLYVGDYAETFETEGDLTNPVAIFSTEAADFAQVVFVNNGAGAATSTDFIAYANNGNDTNGWIDMGITAQTFNDPEFTITGPNDGYIFMSGIPATSSTPVSYSITDNVATIQTAAAHTYTTGTVVVLTSAVLGISGQQIVTGVPTPTSFTFALTASNVASTPLVGATCTTLVGNGNLVLATDGTGLQNRIVFAAGGLSSDNAQMIIIPDQQVHIEIATDSTSPTTGALRVAGGVGITGSTYTDGDIDITGNLYVGSDTQTWTTDTAELTNPVAVFRLDYGTEESSYGQLAFTNTDPTSSTDIIVYMDNGNDTSGWVGIGIAGSEFDDATFGITGPGDAYIFHDTLDDSYTGNLVFATGASGSENKIIFAAGGYASGNTQMEITPGVNVHLEIPTPSTSPTTGAFTVVGGVGIQGDLNIQGDVNIAGTITFGGSGTTVETENLAVSDPFIFVANANPGNVLDFGLLAEAKVPTTLDPQAAITTKAITNSVATLGITYTLGSEPFKVGDSVVITNVDATLNGTYTLTAVTGSSISYAKMAPNVSSTPATTAFVKNITTKALTADVATLTTSSTHDYLVSESVTVTGVDATFNGTYVITAVTSNTFSYAKPGSDVTSQPATTPVTASIITRELNSNIATVTTSAAHGFQLGETVTVTGVTALFNGTHTITNITSTSFSYALVGADVGSTPVSPAGTATVNRLQGTSSVSRLLGQANSTDVLRPRYTGFAKDASDGTWKLFSGATTKPSSTINFSEAGVVYDPVQVGAAKTTTLTATTSVSTPVVTITGTPSANTDAATVGFVKAAAAGWSVATSAFTAVDGDAKFLDTSSAAFTVTLPTTGLVAYSTRLRFADLTGSWESAPPVLQPGANKLMGAAETLSLDIANGSIELIWTGATNGWRIV